MSKQLEKTYNPKEIESKLYEKWCEKKYFHAEVDHSKTPFTIVIPPPNITGQLHMGHALDNTMQDILIRYKRMQGYNALWQPGTDHASIATEVKVISFISGVPTRLFMYLTDSSITVGVCQLSSSRLPCETSLERIIRISLSSHFNIISQSSFLCLNSL